MRRWIVILLLAAVALASILLVAMGLGTTVERGLQSARGPRELHVPPLPSASRSGGSTAQNIHPAGVSR